MCKQCGKHRKVWRGRCGNCWELRKQRPLPFDEAYAEMRYHCGLSDWDIAKRLGVKPLSLLRRCARYGIELRPEFISACVDMKRESQQASRCA